MERYPVRFLALRSQLPSLMSDLTESRLLTMLWNLFSSSPDKKAKVFVPGEFIQPSLVNYWIAASLTFLRQELKKNKSPHCVAPRSSRCSIHVSLGLSFKHRDKEKRFCSKQHTRRKCYTTFISCQLWRRHITCCVKPRLIFTSKAEANLSEALQVLLFRVGTMPHLQILDQEEKAGQGQTSLLTWSLHQWRRKNVFITLTPEVNF